MRRRGLVTLLVALAVAGGSTALAASTPASAGEQFTPVVMSVMSTPSWFRGADGDVHLAYELQMLNAFPVGVTVQSIDVRNADTDQSILNLTGDDLLGTMSLLPSGGNPTTHLTPAQTGVAWFDTSASQRGELPARVEHVVTVDVEPGLPVPDTIVEEGARAKVDRDPPMVIGPPLHGKRWLALGSCCDGPHRRSAQSVNGKIWLAQRFAIDYNRLFSDNFLVHGDPSLNESWATYGQPVYAVGNGKVIQAVDGLPDQIPDAPVPVTIENADGNYVILKLAKGVYAFYAHLRPGTVTVEPGDHAFPGQVLGETGNSGSSTGPHLHFQLMDRPSALKANGVPYVFRKWELQGQGPPLDELLMIDPVTTPVPIATDTAGPQRRTLPLGSNLIDHGH